MTEHVLRVFVAAPLSEPAKAHLSSVQRHLMTATDTSEVRWVSREGLHITLKFLGAVQSQRVAGIAEALQRAAIGVMPLNLRLATLGAFPSLNRPRVIWAGSTGDTERLGALQQAVEGELVALQFPRETRPFSAHITLGRVRDQVSARALQLLWEAMESMKILDEAPAVPVETMVLYQSTLTRSGAIYSPLAVVPLNGGQEQPEQ